MVRGLRSAGPMQPHRLHWLKAGPAVIHPLERPSQEDPGSGFTAVAPVSDFSAPAFTNEIWPPLRPVSVAQKNKLSTMLSSNVQSIDLPMDCMPDGSGR